MSILQRNFFLKYIVYFYCNNYYYNNDTKYNNTIIQLSLQILCIIFFESIFTSQIQTLTYQQRNKDESQIKELLTIRRYRITVSEQFELVNKCVLEE
jgi:predicted ATPase